MSTVLEEELSKKFEEEKSITYSIVDTDQLGELLVFDMTCINVMPCGMQEFNEIYDASPTRRGAIVIPSKDINTSSYEDFAHTISVYAINKNPIYFYAQSKFIDHHNHSPYYDTYCDKVAFSYRSTVSKLRKGDLDNLVFFNKDMYNRLCYVLGKNREQFQSIGLEYEPVKLSVNMRWEKDTQFYRKICLMDEDQRREFEKSIKNKFQNVNIDVKEEAVDYAFKGLTEMSFKVFFNDEEWFRVVSIANDLSKYYMRKRYDYGHDSWFRWMIEAVLIDVDSKYFDANFLKEKENKDYP